MEETRRHVVICSRGLQHGGTVTPQRVENIAVTQPLFFMYRTERDVVVAFVRWHRTKA